MLPWLVRSGAASCERASASGARECEYTRASGRARERACACVRARVPAVPQTAFWPCAARRV
eukprot:5747519-Prymnesium_polylepis.1